MPSKCTCIAATFTTHPWVIRNSDSILSRYVGDTATIEILSDGKCNVHEGKAKHVGPAPRQTPAQWGSYRSKCQVRGVTIMAFECVPETAITAAAESLRYMLHDTPTSICQRLVENDADIAIIGRDQVVSDMPPHGHLRGQSCAVGDRNFDHGTRGVGGNLACPTCSVGEENVTMLNDKHYGQENILIHEFAHSVMCIGMDDEQRHSICAAFQEAQQSGSYRRHIYMMENADEYWAEATQSWFDATVRTDVNDGVNTREKLKKHDPLLATLLMNAYGDGPWRYTHTMPREWGGKARSSPVWHYHQQMQSLDAGFQQPHPQLQLHQAPVHHKRSKSRFCCFPFSSALGSKLQ
ncbi:hypothetical protein ABBQ32_005920 [Trebouxia sp. C0010 RCD-2024]